MVERLRRQDNENLLADRQGPDMGGYYVIVALGLIYFVIQAIFRIMAGLNPIPL